MSAQRAGSNLERVVTSGTFSLDGGTWEVENNVWLVGDSEQVAIIDAAHDADAISAAVGNRKVPFIICTHAHDDHVNVAPELSRRFNAPLLLHPGEYPLWELAHPGTPPPDLALDDGDMLKIAGTELRILHTPGHSPGSCCLHAPELGILFSGDTLFKGGPGATGRSFSSFDTIIASIRSTILALPDDTEVRPGHGDSTVVGDEAKDVSEWLSRGH